MTERILLLRNLFLYGSTRKYYKTYTSTSYLILVLRSISWSYRTYTCINKLILVFQILYLYYRTYTYISDLVLVLQNIYMYLKSYTCLTDLILVLQNLFLSYGSYSCAKVPVGTISRNKSESYHLQGQIRLMQIRTLVRSRYISHQIQIPGLYRFRTYPKTNRVVSLYQNHL